MQSPFEVGTFDDTLLTLIRQAYENIEAGGSGICVESPHPRALRLHFYRILKSLRDEENFKTYDSITFTVGAKGELWLIPQQDRAGGRGAGTRHKRGKGDDYFGTKD